MLILGICRHDKDISHEVASEVISPLIIHIFDMF